MITPPLTREQITINTHGDMVQQLDNTGGHQAYLDYRKSLERLNNVTNNKILLDEKSSISRL